VEKTLGLRARNSGRRAQLLHCGLLLNCSPAHFCRRQNRAVEQVNSRAVDKTLSLCARSSRPKAPLLHCGLLLNCFPADLAPGLNMAFMFENLQVYQKAVDLADRIASLTETFPRGYYFLVDQLNRAALTEPTGILGFARRGHRG